jgi:hypothetical protein
LKDVRNGFVSIEKAGEDHGVVTDLLMLKMDEEEAREKREKINQNL